MKTVQKLGLSGTKRSTKARRLAREASERPAFELGTPERPAGLPRAQRRAWNALCLELLASRKLSKTDGPLLLELLQARAEIYKGAGERREIARKRVTEIQATFDARQPFSEPQPDAGGENKPAEPAFSLEAFLANVQQERHSFSSRMQPGQTVCLDISTENKLMEYAWPENDAATVARNYCQHVTQGGIIACDLLKRSCARHLSDLETGASRGLFFDPVAARHIVQWFEHFCGLHLESWEQWILTCLFGWKQPSPNNS